ncbi:MAG: alpha-E domain-containing protein, partial [Actinomycetota bacterium]|nr:alpha-E domain-containing protein [Actinomycetota bacterium]
MLSRIAESLFWIGRYTERAEDTARILDVHFHLLLEDPWVDERAACQGLLEIMGVPRPTEGELDARRVSQLIAFDLTNASSIVGSLTAARENARGAREAISSEMWECLNATYNELPTQVASARALGPHNFFRYVKERAAVMAGLADATLSRDDGWRFFVLGRSLERVDMTCRLLSARFGEGAGSPGWVTLLRSCSAHEAYLRTYRRAVDASLVAEFLLLDRLFPRS